MILLFCLAATLQEPAVNEWTLIHREDGSGGKAFAKAVYAGRIYLWGTGGRKPARNVYERYELESFSAAEGGWAPAFPTEREGQWRADDFPPFRIYGQSGPDGLKYDEGPRQQGVGGYKHTNRVWWWDFDGVKRPSPIHTFNMAAHDTRRNRIVYHADGATFALDPRTNRWIDLETPNHPTTCRTVAWASMSYDSDRDRIMLFGGGLATNPSGAAPTWFYECGANRWVRPKLDLEPPPRCNGALVYDAERKAFVLFGGYDQAAGLNDTWVYDGTRDAWRLLQMDPSPPPMEAPAGCSLGDGRVLVCGNDARKVRMHHRERTSASKETWVFDGRRWLPVDGDLRVPGERWMTATGTSTPGEAFLVTFGTERRTYRLAFDGAGGTDELAGAPPGTVAWKYPEQKDSLEDAPPGDPDEHAKVLAELPPNTFVDAKPPGMLISKTWSTAVIDTDRHEVIYHGGGHSGYSGNDFARYSIRENRWTLDAPPRFPPFLEGTNAGIFGWSYGMVPFSQHTYLWYCYDPSSRTVVYLARPELRDGIEVDARGKVFPYEAKKHGYGSWVYDSTAKRLHPPSFGRPFANPWHLALVGTREGVYALCRNETWHGTVDRETGEVGWKRVDREFPEPPLKTKYHYEYQPVVSDGERLYQLKGDKERVDVYVREGGAWRGLETKGKAAIGREAMYLPKHRSILWLGDALHVLDLDTRTMKRVDVELPKGLYGHECAMVYDPALDVCVALIPSRFSGPMQTFLFRYVPGSAR